MAKKTTDIDLTAVVDGEDDTYYYKLYLSYNNVILSTLEFSDISEDILQLLEINKKCKEYTTDKKLLADLAQYKLDCYLGNEIDEESSIFTLLDIKIEEKHNSGKCNKQCKYCSPENNVNNDLSGFLENLDTAEIKGSA